MFQQVMQALWSCMSVQINIYGFTVTLGGIFIFSLITSLVAYALFKILWG